MVLRFIFLDPQILQYEQIPLELSNHKMVIMESVVKIELVESELIPVGNSVRE
jgi:galactokinase